jgi:hypothetical protein
MQTTEEEGRRWGTPPGSTRRTVIIMRALEGQTIVLWPSPFGV